MIRRPPRSTRTDTLFPTRRSSDLPYCRGRSTGDANRGRGEDRGLQADARSLGAARPAAADRKSTRLNSITNAHLVCRLLLEKKKEINKAHNKQLLYHHHTKD